MSKTKKKQRVKHIKQSKKIGLIIIVFLLMTIFALFGIVVRAYYNIESAMNDTYEVAERKKNIINPPISRSEGHSERMSGSEPFSILLLGVDTGALGRTEQGRSDTMIVATVNPSTKQSLLLSLPRDTYTEIVGHNTQDKINHAYAFGGAGMSMDTVEKLLDIPIDHYVTINMEGIMSLVDIVDGIEVNNPFEFNYQKTTFVKGKQQLDGKLALKYARMRYDDPNGDYGRQARQRQIITGIAHQMLSMKGVTNYKSILEVMSKQVKTDLSFQNIQTLVGDYRAAFETIKSDQMKGEGFMQDGISYQRIDQNELIRVQSELKALLN
ncbi:LCP family glycopolymer transferase [Enterococcus sp. AZ126]|uniref:LCP family glycopolymer transferase n=1 Tax=Enterococcus sp. AZ126 TaxID=2774635 RepID=UPI003F28DF76